MPNRWCTERGCDRLAIVTVIDIPTGRGGHLCQEHAVLWAAAFVAADADMRLRGRAETPTLAVLRGGRGEGS